MRPWKRPTRPPIETPTVVEKEVEKLRKRLDFMQTGSRTGSMTGTSCMREVEAPTSWASQASQKLVHQERSRGKLEAATAALGCRRGPGQWNSFLLQVQDGGARHGEREEYLGTERVRSGGGQGRPGRPRGSPAWVGPDDSK